MIHLDFHDPRPMYEQVVEQFEMLIARGALAADERIPSVRQLSVQFSLNPNTVQKAYSELLGRGEIYSVRGKGNFVSGDQTGIRNKKLEQIYQEIDQLEKSKVEVKHFSRKNEQYFYFALIGALLLIVEALGRYTLLRKIP